MMIKSVQHTAAAGDAAALGLALAVARELHPPVRRAAELAPAVSQPKQHRASGRRRTVRS
ncbi:hypothetical protein [Streptomyces triticiradicis]|uniref:Uncharacterized protein n=1 Tax=Streptomyces triticiradicis TaxID=2651189 RepID=A0A7J5D927_9ACTN|nr:hypothetical protein [Streptomyces triticiradicis]KAB1982344.1 hypothetical protein F8144_30790 [Streptomyces triticiradicis]